MFRLLGQAAKLAQGHCPDVVGCGVGLELTLWAGRKQERGRSQRPDTLGPVESLAIDLGATGGQGVDSHFFQGIPPKVPCV